MSQLGTVYATKRRRRNGKSLKPPPKDGVTKSNPSKRHRERLNAELDLLASLLPFEQNILSKLDRLSILRLSVSYLRTKSYFQVVMHKDKEENGILSHLHSHHDSYRARDLGAIEHHMLDGDMFLQALNGFLMILTCEGEVFFATHSIESYLGFHQSDIVHQSVYELVHSEDREELQRQLMWNSFLPADLTGMPLSEALAPDKITHLERSFTVRFRCLLDNTSGFLRLDIRGRVKILHGQNRKTEEPPLGLFCYCTPFGPPSLLELPQKENMFKSKHKLDLSLVSMDQRGKQALGYSDSELANMGGYDLVHYDDLAYVASAHQEMLKTGASGMIAYRYQKKDGTWQWLQTSSRLVYKNSKPDFVICTHRQLMEEEGRDLLGKRTMDFKVSYLDTGLSSSYFTDTDQLIVPSAGGGSPNAIVPPPTVHQPRANRRYKTQLRDFLSTCRTKRKSSSAQSSVGQITPPTPVVEYIPDASAAVAASYSNLNPMYPSPYAAGAENFYIQHSYPGVTENLFHQYRLQGVGSYYPDYHHSPTSTSYMTANGFLPYESPYGISATAKEEKWNENSKYYGGSDNRVYSGYTSPAQVIQPTPHHKTPKTSPPVIDAVSCSSGGPSPVTTHNIQTPNSNNSTSTNNNNIPPTPPNSNSSNGILAVTPKIEHSPPISTQSQYERQTVLMWGASNNNSSRSPNTTPTSNGAAAYQEHHVKQTPSHQISPTSEDSHHASSAATPGSLSSHLKWNGITKDVPPGVHVYPLHQHHELNVDHSAAMYQQALSHHSAGGHLDHSLHQGQNAQNNCEVITVGGSSNGSRSSTIHHNTITLSLAQQRLHPSVGSFGSSCPSPTRFHAYPTIAYHTHAYATDPDGSPLLSFSEVTNTLLNQ
ncbi:aryl hydrocarbon receptor [Culicoides brevitarsis]|uniref:aryl hydrocarbon receptor n=1 Tax=Culicoides brevitarsis TaxID=469753 RepID=UPI00307BACFA